MIGKKGKAIVIIIIIILCISWIGIGFLETFVQPIKLDKPYGWILDLKDSSSDETWISGKIDITNLPENPVIDFSLQHTKGVIKIGNEEFGEILFINKSTREILRAGEKIKDASLKIGEKKPFDFYIRILNRKIPALWDILLDNDNNEEISFNLVFNFSIANTDIEWESQTFWNKTIRFSICELIAQIS